MKRLASHCIKMALIVAQIITLANSQSKNPHKNEQQYQFSKKLNIINEFNVWISIECYNISRYIELQELTADQLYVVKNETETVKLYDCPLPDNGETLSAILQNMGIFSYRSLFIKNDNLIETHLTRGQFKNVLALQRLTMQLRYLTQLPEYIFADTALRNLTTLDLYTNVTHLSHHVFANLKNLLYLNIGHNLESLCDGQFRKQSKLLILNLSRNKLIKLSSDIFANNAVLQVMQLENNELATLPSHLLDRLSSLSKVDLNLNRLESLPDQLFANTFELKEFVLTKNRFNLLTLPHNFLSHLWQLAKVEFRCGLEFLPSKVFFNSTNIQEIILQSNNLKEIPNDLLESQTMLLYLDFSHNYLEEIPTGLFHNTLQLKILKLANNRLKTIERNSLVHLKNLELLDLSCNQLNSHDFRIKLETSINLKFLYLQNNSITDLFVLLGHLPQNLRRLNLSFNKIFQLLDEDLEQLFTDNLILNLTHNRIQTVQLQDFHKHNIYIVTDLNNNPLKCDCRIVESMTHLAGLHKQLQFQTEHLTCSEPSRLKGRQVRLLNKMELMCLIETTHLNNYQCPEQCECWLRSHDNVLLVDCAQKNLTQVPTIPTIADLSLNGMEINLTLNQITHLPSSKEPGYANVTKLFLSNNKLSTFDKSQIPANLTLLDLRHNHLRHLNEETISYLTSTSLLKNILLSRNQWQCDCSDEVLLFFSLAQSFNEKFTDASQLACHNYPNTNFTFELQGLCHQHEIILITAVCFSLALVFILLALTFVYKNHIKIWFYGHNVCLRFVATYDDDDSAGQIYDAFVSYSHKDEDFVANHLVPELENGDPPYKLCVHARDFLVGQYIPDQIVNAIADSSRVIVVLSKNFICSEWAKLEFKEAYRATLMARRQKLIIIMYEDIDKDAELDKELKVYLKMNTYLKWGDPRFWQKLRFTMPHKQ